jgi:hypothetical protein
MSSSAVSRSFNTHISTYSMEQSPSWEANQSLLLVKKFPTVLWNPKVLYRTHNCPPPVPILSQLHPVPPPPPTSWRAILTLSSHLRLGLPNGLFPSGFPTNTLCTSLSYKAISQCLKLLALSLRIGVGTWSVWERWEIDIKYQAEKPKKTV